LSRDLPETDKTVRGGPDGTIQFSVPMKSNDIVLITLESARAN
jgi:xylan 1,4-beta-xylosidase